jgi:hypothetical protein
MQIMRKPFVILFILSFLCPAVSAEVQRKKFSTTSAYLVIEVLDDDLLISS